MIQEDVLCSFCGCLCDDITVDVEEDQSQACQARLPPGGKQDHGARED